MADQTSSDFVAMAGEGQLAASTAATAADSAALAAATGATVHQAHHGRPISWICVVIILAGFLAGGLGLVIGPTWWLFWAGIGLAGFGGIVALATGIFNDWY